MPGGRARSNPEKATRDWETNTVAAADIWSANVKSFSGNYVRGLSTFFGQTVSDTNVHVMNYKNFANSSDTYKAVFTSGVENAAAQNKWYTKFSRAFGVGTAGGGAPTAPAGRVRVYRYGPQ